MVSFCYLGRQSRCDDCTTLLKGKKGCICKELYYLKNA